MSDKNYTMPDNPNKKFYRDMLIKLLTPSEYDNPEGRKILGEEFDKAIEELKKRVEEDALKEPNASTVYLDEIREQVISKLKDKENETPKD